MFNFTSFDTSDFIITDYGGNATHYEDEQNQIKISILQEEFGGGGRGALPLLKNNILESYIRSY